MTDLVYHYTDTARLPWIVDDGVLRPGRNKIGGFPDPDFVWATVSPVGDRTSSLHHASFRSGSIRAVRFVLRAEDFEPWPEIRRRYPQWTPDHVTRLEAAAKGLSQPADWRCRAEPLPASRWVAVETRTYQTPTWSPLADPKSAIFVRGDDAGVRIGKLLYLASRFDGPGGCAAYSVGTIEAAA